VLVVVWVRDAVLSRMARKCGSSAAMFSRMSTVADTSTERNPVESSMANWARGSRRKMAYLTRLRLVEN
jgi:hypothetical protein